MLRDTVFIMKLKETCSFEDIDVDCWYHNSCDICQIKSSTMNHVIRRGELKDMDENVVAMLKEKSTEELECFFFECKEC